MPNVLFLYRDHSFIHSEKRIIEDLITSVKMITNNTEKYDTSFKMRYNNHLFIELLARNDGAMFKALNAALISS